MTYVLDSITDDLTLYGPTGTGDCCEVNKSQRRPETQNRLTTMKVDEQLPGPQGVA